MKSSHYVGTVTRAYREAIDSCISGSEPDYDFWRDELNKIATRPYTTGFLYGQPNDAARDYEKKDIKAQTAYCGLVIGYDLAYRRALVEERAPFAVGDVIEVFTPQGERFRFTLPALYGADRVPLERARHARELLWVPIERYVMPYTLLRKVKGING